MIRQLLHQMRNEKSANTSLFLELFLVSVVLWFAIDFLYIRYKAYVMPLGFDITNCYSVSISEYPESYDGYDKEADQSEALSDLARIIRQRPDVEAVSLSFSSVPYSPSCCYNILGCRDSVGRGLVLSRTVTPDFVRVFRLEGENGESPEQVAEAMQQMPPNSILLARTPKENSSGKRTSDLIGKDFYWTHDSTRILHLQQALQPVRYRDFDLNYTPFVIKPISDDHLGQAGIPELSILLLPAAKIGFVSRFMKDAGTYYRSGNLFVSGVRPFSALRNDALKSNMLEIRSYMIGIGFLLFNIFLGLLGIFWFRTQRRRSEIALHMAFGSTRRQVFGRLILEGLILLTLATLPALLVDYNIARLEFTQPDGGSYISASRFAVTTGITWLLMALMMIVGILFPARKAMKIEPAQALHEE